jgi:hypothetical protein
MTLRSQAVCGCGTGRGGAVKAVTATRTEGTGMGRDDEPVDNLWRLAVHELGHGIAYVTHGGTVTALTAWPWVKTGGFDGHCEGELGASIKALGMDARHVFVACAALAGRMAEQHFFPSIDPLGCTSDRQDFVEHVERLESVWHTGASVKAWEAAIGELVRPMIAAHDRIIAYVAKTLADERWMGERRVAELFHLARQLWGIQPGPLLRPAWRVGLEAALTQSRRTMTR